MSISPSNVIESAQFKEKQIREFDRVINEFINEGLNFGFRFINDYRARLRYEHLVKEAAKQIQNEVSLGRISLEEGAMRAAALRNDYIHLVRDVSSDIGRELAKFHKKTDSAFSLLLNKYSKKLFVSNFSELTFDTQRRSVFLAILESASASSKPLSSFNRFLGHTGRVLTVVSIAVVIYHICASEDKWMTGLQEGTGFALGSMLAMGGGWAGMFCGPGAIICVPLGVFIGGILGAYGAEYLFLWKD
jgi:hypothetical protein